MLIIVHTEKLGLLGGTKLQAGNQVNDLGNGGRHGKSIGGRGKDDSDLPADNCVVAVKETTFGTRVDTIKADDLLGGEESVEDEANHATDTVFGEDIERVVNMNEEFDCEGY